MNPLNYLYFIAFVLICVFCAWKLCRMIQNGRFDLNDTYYDPCEIDNTKYEEEEIER